VKCENTENRLVIKPLAKDKAPLEDYLQMWVMKFPWLPCRCPKDSHSFHMSAVYLTAHYLPLL
jgi:hypothetical protein